MNNWGSIFSIKMVRKKWKGLEMGKNIAEISLIECWIFSSGLSGVI